MKINSAVLTSKSNKTESYQIANLFYIALFGGAIPLSYLALQNMRMLNIKGKKLFLWIGIAILFIFIRVMIMYLFETYHLDEHSGRLKFAVVRMLDLFLFIGYYRALKFPYRVHMIYHAQCLSLLDGFKGIFLCVGGMIIDVILLVILSV